MSVVSQRAFCQYFADIPASHAVQVDGGLWCAGEADDKSQYLDTCFLVSPAYL